MSNPLCIYHGNCADGFGAAWAVWRYFGEGGVDFHAGVYQDAPPDVVGRDVILVDFSYKRAVLEGMAKAARSILILDHHVTAAEDLLDIPAPVPGGWREHIRDCVSADPMQWAFPSYVRAVFDLKKSGAVLAWEYFHPDEPVPHLLEIVQDRDLGGGIAFPPKIEHTRDAMTAIFSHPYNFARWSQLAAECEDRHSLGKLLAEGRAIDRKHFKDIREFIGVAKRRMVIGGHDVPVLNAPYFWSSDAGHIMAEGEPFAACYWDTASGRVFSLRSRDGGADVSEIAKRYGGGGHQKAAGFRCEVGWEGDR